MIDMLIHLILVLLVVGILLALVVYVADSLLPQPIGKIVKVAAIVLGALAVILVLLRMAGYDTGTSLQL